MFPMGVHSAPITRGGKPVGLRGLAIDMSEHKLIEAEMQKAQKLESLGILAGGIAHDFNNILTAILGNIALTRMRLKPDSFEQLRLEEAEKASLHAKDLTLQLLTFSKGGEPVKKAVAIDRVIRDAVSFALRGARVKSSLHFDAGLWPIAADAGQMGQVFQNLVLNACQAMPAGGVIGIEARNAEVDSLGGLPVLRGRYVQVTVRDEGAGIPEEHLSKIFDPFFTTKHAGSGLGLAVTYSIIKSHGGHISVRSRPGEGTTFTVLLPASELLCESSQKTAVVAFQRKGSILIMDDEDMVRDVAGAIIREFGYEVAFARDGREAILLYTAAAKAGKPFDAVIMDLTIPGGMGGMETVQELRQTDPAVKAVASSGYSNDPVLANYGDYGFSAVITKPYTPAELGEVLQKLLDTYNTE
jgi:nitrogen-specific signal transduction histidine kinase/CheY-like chemotaxis protein